jgi:hypothetical protein
MTLLAISAVVRVLIAIVPPAMWDEEEGLTRLGIQLELIVSPIVWVRGFNRE